VNRVLLFSIPPVAGAIIGYVTNAIAIKMLFRPLNPIYIFGFKLPLTPGILPRQRKKLALSIGAMVERELLTAEVLRNRLANIDIKNFQGIITEFLRREDIRKEFESKGRILMRNAFSKMNTLQRFFISAGQYDQTLEQKMPEIIDELITSVETLLQEDRIKAKILAAVDGQVENILASINIKTLVSDRIDSLEMVRVEKIILDVMADQFKWINVFGGLLGFLIGAFQSAFAYFFR
jgi:uncharacterized membrane protein YheB (UPF0754 family)